MSSLADAMIMASLLNNNNGSMFESRRTRPVEADFLTNLKRFQRYQDTMETTREKKEQEKKDKDKKPENKISYLEACFWLFFLSPIIGPLWYNLENALIKSMH
jgi:hypothetical protein